MSEVELAVEELRRHVKDQQILVDARDQAIALASVPAFRKLILDGFCLHEAARYAQESGDPMLTPTQRQDALNMAQASGHLKRFLSLTITMGNTAANSVRQADLQIQELLNPASVEEEGADE